MITIRSLLSYFALLITTSAFSIEYKNSEVTSSIFKQPIFKNVDVDNYIFSGKLYKIVQDSHGFIWFAGTKGIARFDGYNLINFTHNPNDEHSIQRDSIRTISPDHNGGIWIAYNNSGLGHYNAQTEQFTAFSHLSDNKNSPSSNTIRDIAVKKNGDLWIGTTKGLDYLNVKDKVFTHFLSKSEQRHSSWIFDLTLDKSEKLWITTPYGIKVIEQAKNSFSYPVLYNRAGEVLSTKQLKLRFRKSFTANDGRIWLIGQNNKIYVINPKTSKRIRVDTSLSQADSNYVAINQVDDENIWISNYRTGIEVFDMNSLVKKHDIKANKYQKNGLENALINDIMTDKEGNTWVNYRSRKPKFTNQHLTAFDYVNTEFNVNNVFFEKNIQDIVALENNQYLLLDKSQLSFIDRNRQTIESYQPVIIEKGTYTFKSMATGAQNELWIITVNGTILNFNLLTKKYTLHATISSVMPGYQARNIYYVGEDKLLISTNSGAQTFNPNTNTFTPLLKENQQEINAYIWSIISTKDNNYFLAASDGLYYQLSGQKHFQHIATDGLTFAGKQVKKLLVDKQQKLWMFTDLNSYQIQLEQDKLSFKPLKKYKNKPIKGQLPLIDHQGNIWLNTYLYYSPVEEEFTDLYHYRLNKNIRLTTPSKSVTSPYFWSTEQAVFIQTSLLEKPKKVSPIKIVELNINGKKYISPQLENLTITADNQQLNLQFAALDYLYADQLSYQYKLSGFDKIWQYSSKNERRAVYSSLAPGEYTFKIKALLNNNFNTEQELQFRVTVLPKIYQIIWFKLFLGFLFLLGIVWLHKFFLNKKLAHEQQINEHKIAQEKSQLLEELIQKKNQILADVSHELNTPLTVLKLQVESLKDNIEEDVQVTYDALDNKLDDIQNLIDDINQLAQSDVGALVLNFQQFDLNETLQHWQNELTQFVKQNKLSFEINKDLPSELMVNLDRDRIKQVFINLLTNSIKYTEKPGKVHLVATIKNDALLLTIEDSAPSVSNKDLITIFERLYRAENSRSRATGGSGLGLAICKSLIEAHGGNIHAEQSGLGGLKIVISLPLEVTCTE